MAGTSAEEVPVKQDTNENENDLLLYGHASSPCSQKVEFALYEKKLKFKTQTIAVFAGEQYEPWFIKLNPKGEVPVLKDGVKIIPDSRRIIEYIEDNFSNGDVPRLIPKKGSKEYQTMASMEEIFNTVNLSIISFGCIVQPQLTGKITMQKEEMKYRLDHYSNNVTLLNEYSKKYKDLSDYYLSKKTMLDRQWNDYKDSLTVKLAIEDLLTALKAAERELESHKGEKTGWWLCGEKFSLADISLCVLLYRIKILGLMEFYVKESDYPCLLNYFRRVQMKESFRKTMYQNSSILKSFCCMGTKEDIYLMIGSTAAIICALTIAVIFLRKK